MITMGTYPMNPIAEKEIITKPHTTHINPENIGQSEKNWMKAAK